jgi:hypothetical protein
VLRLLDLIPFTTYVQVASLKATGRDRIALRSAQALTSTESVSMECVKEVLCEVHNLATAVLARTYYCYPPLKAVFRGAKVGVILGPPPLALLLVRLRHNGQRTM